tara:strand:- start:20 stop:1132 length:1113 start_codon:yes stop_codon:yes gene_type:complete
MKTQEIKFKDKKNSYSIIIGKNILNILPKRVKNLCPKTKKIGIIIDKNIPKKYKRKLINVLKKYHVDLFAFSPSEKNKSLNTVNIFLKKLLIKNYNRSDLIISVGGGITSDVSGFISSVYKRGINFINLPTTLLGQVDAAIGGKTAVNSTYGKNLIGTFYQPRLVLSDTQFLYSLKKKEMVGGYAEILKHSLIKDKSFFNWLKLNTKNVLNKKSNALIYAIKKSCQIKLYFVNKDVNEKNLRMILNFGHTFAHAIEVKNNYSKKISHGEAVLAGMILVTKLSLIKKVCNRKILDEIVNIYNKNNLSYTYKRYSSKNDISKLIPFLKNDKKNDDEKVNFILLRNIGRTTLPNKFKISIKEIMNYTKLISQY